MGLGGRHRNAERGRRLVEGASGEEAFEEARLGGREPKTAAISSAPAAASDPPLMNTAATASGSSRVRNCAVRQRQDMREQRRLVALVEPDGETRLAERGLVLRARAGWRSEALWPPPALSPARRRGRFGSEPPWRSILSAARLACKMEPFCLVSATPHLSASSVSAIRVPLDGARVEHLADRDRAAQMGQQEPAELDLALGEDAVPLQPAGSKHRGIVCRPNEEIAAISTKPALRRDLKYGEVFPIAGTEMT